jgi:hypothetical protein
MRAEARSWLSACWLMNGWLLELPLLLAMSLELDGELGRVEAEGAFALLNGGLTLGDGVAGACAVEIGFEDEGDDGACAVVDGLLLGSAGVEGAWAVVDGAPPGNGVAGAAAEVDGEPAHGWPLVPST